MYSTVLHKEAPTQGSASLLLTLLYNILDKKGHHNVIPGIRIHTKPSQVIHQAWNAVFDHQMKHWEDIWKYDAQPSIFDELWGDITSQTKWF